MEYRAHQVLAQLVESLREVADREPPPACVGAEARRGLFNRLIQHPGGAVVQWVRAVDLRPFPGHPIATQVDLLPEP